jgi:glycosyltransferase involved in cell wall biosynthesis
MQPEVVPPRITVIVATYNCAEMLRITLNSILLQDFSDFEVLVIGDGCSDHSGEVVAGLADARFQWLNLARNHRAPYAAHNEGIRRARANYIAYLNHDDLWFPWHLSRLLHHLEQSGADFVYDAMVSVDRSGAVLLRGEVHSFKRAVFGHPSAWCHRKAICDARLTWRNPYEVGSATDSHFLASAHRLGYKLAFVNSLGGLKFGSGNWEHFQAREFPQAMFLKRLQADPQALAGEQLLDCAVAMAALLHDRTYPSLSLAVASLLRTWVWQMYHLLGDERPWVRLLRRYYFAQLRRRYNRQRGLPF